MVETKLFDLTGQVALLTGASKGMGKEMALGLAEHGAKVVVSSRKLDQCEEAAAEINDLYGEKRAWAAACNIGYKEELEKLVALTHENVGKVDTLVCNAGVNPYYGPMSETPDEAWDKTMAANVKSNHWLAHMVAPDMIEKGSGSMMITASVGAFGPSDMLGIYAISKLADNGVVRNLALEYGPKGIRANAICPGLIKTDFAKALWDNPEASKRVTERTPLRRLGEPDDFRGIAVFLASDASKYMTGQAVTVCGGTHMWA